MADAGITAVQAESVENEALRIAAQNLLDDVKMDLELNEGEVAMFVLDMPDVPPQFSQVMIAQTNQAQAGAAKPERALGVCHPVANASGATRTLENVVDPVLTAKAYFRLYEKQKIEGLGKVTILQGPKHGVLRLVTEADRGQLFSSSSGPVTDETKLYVYLPEPGYIGKDSATVLVEVGGFKVKVIYALQAVDAMHIGWDFEKQFCSSKGYRWKISSINNDPTGQLLSFNAPNQLTSYLAGAINTNIAIADLTDGALGQTTGTTITLDDNAAGHGWFIDSTPWSNDEFLPTHNPNEWIAKEGSDAAGKMDMLSVLLHEYGHVLGINHSANGHDLMATTLTPGMRRMPTTDELALMAELVVGLKADLQASSAANSVTTNTSDNSPLPFPWLPLDSTLGLAFLGRLRSRLSGLAADNAALTLALSQREREVVQYDVVANATLLNGSLGD